jgi:hypothetical protein
VKNRRKFYRPNLEHLEHRRLPAFIVTFVNQSGSALIRQSDELDEGIWTNGEPPVRIEAGATVSWGSEPAIGPIINGKVNYQLEGTPLTTQLHWDNVGDGLFSDQPTPAGFNLAITPPFDDGTNVSASATLSIRDTSGDGIPDDWKTNGIPITADGSQRYPLPGATVGKKDVYVEVDSMTGLGPAALPPIASATGAPASPIVVTTSTAHGLSTGTRVTITGNSVANGTFTVTRLNPTQFQLNGTAGTGTSAMGGTWSLPDLVGTGLATGTDLDLVVDVFKNHGINLHVEIDSGVDAAIPVAAWPASTLDSTGWPTPFTALATDGLGQGIPTPLPSLPGFGSVNERTGIMTNGLRANPAAILAAKKLVFRYCAFALSYGTNPMTGGPGGSSGQTYELPGNWFYVTVGNSANYPKSLLVEWQVATFMHELGHTLGLGHGGEVAPMVGTLTAGSPVVTLQSGSVVFLQNFSQLFVSGPGIPPPTLTGSTTVRSVNLIPNQIILSANATISGQATLYFSDGGCPIDNYKPNYESIMNYEWQFPFFLTPAATTPQQAFNASWQLDYSEQALPNLNENSLTMSSIGGTGRTEGILPTISPANCLPTYASFVTDNSAVSWGGTAVDVNGDGTLAVLQGSNDWGQVIFNFRGSSGFGGGPRGSADTDQTSTDNIIGLFAYTAPPGTRPNDLTLRLNGADLQIFDNNTQVVVASQPLAETSMIEVAGADGQQNKLTVDFGFGGFFSLPGGISFTGGVASDNRLRIIGTGQTTGTYTPDASAPGYGKATVALANQSVAIGFTGLKTLGASGMTNYKLDDSADPLDNPNVVLSADTQQGHITGLGTAHVAFDWSAINAITVTSGSGRNTIQVDSLPSGTTTNLVGHGPVTVNVGNGGTVHGIGRTLNIENPPSLTTINVDDSADTSGRIVTLGTFTPAGDSDPWGYINGLAPANINYEYADTSSLTVNTGDGGDVVNILSTGVPTTLISTTFATDTHPAFLTSFNVGAAGRVKWILQPLNIEVSAQSDGLNFITVDDSLDPNNATATLGTFTPTGDTAWGFISGLAQANINYRYADTGSLTVHTGSFSDNTVNVQGTGAVTTLVAHAPATFNIGSAANTLDSIQGTVSVQGAGGNTTLNVIDTGTSVSQDYGVYATSIHRFDVASPFADNIAVISYQQIRNLFLYLGQAQSGPNAGVIRNIADIFSTPAATITTINGGSGINTSTVAPFDAQPGMPLDNTGIQGAVSVHGGGNPNDSVTYYDFLDPTPGQTYTMSVTKVGGQIGGGQIVDNGFATVTYDSKILAAGLFTAEQGGSTVSVLGTAVHTQVEAGTGDSVIVGTPVAGGRTLADISAFLNIFSFDGNPNQVLAGVLIDDSGDMMPHPAVVINGGAVYPGPDVVNLAQGIISWRSLAPATPVHILGGSGGNTFALMAMPINPLTLDGGSGTHNKLDYSGYTGPQNNTVQVVLPLDQATGIVGISRIQDVTGGSGNNLLVGDANPNILIGGTGRNILIGGGGGDTLDAHLSTGDNLLIAGTTSFDGTPNYLADLDAIFAEWTRTDLSPTNSFQLRYNDLLSGTGSTNPMNRLPDGTLVLLTPATNKTSSNGTVHADLSPDTLIGSNGIDPTTSKRVHNWFFFDSDDMIVNFINPFDHKNKVT